MAFVVAGFSKVYVGEIVEKGKTLLVHSQLVIKTYLFFFLAKEIMEEWGHTGAIRPEHLREAHRRYKKESATNATLGRRL